MKRFFQNITLLIVTFFFCFLLFETGLRFFPGTHFDYGANAADESLIWLYNAELGWSMQPNSKATFSRPEFSAQIQTNALGLRDDELTATKSENEIRILLLGDSVVAGFEVARENTLEYHLQKMLQMAFPEKKIEVINAGVRGYGTDQELLYLQSRGLALQPDIVVLGFVPANDLENNVTVHSAGRVFSKPYFEFDDKGVPVLRGVPVPQYLQKKQIYSRELPQLHHTEVAEKSGHQKAWKVFFSKNLYTYGFVARRLKSASPALIGWFKKYGILHNPLPKEQVDFYRFFVDKTWAARWRITLALIEKIHQTCAARNIAFLLWSFPLKEQVYPRDREIFTRSFAVASDELDFELPDKKLRAFAVSKKIGYISTSAEFARRAQQGERFHFLTDHHFNEKGHKLMAEILAEKISEKLQ